MNTPTPRAEPAPEIALDATQTSGTMVQFLSEEWLELFAGYVVGLADMPDVSLSIQFDIGRDTGFVSFHTTWVDGVLREIIVGQREDVDLRISMTRETAALYYQGQDVVEHAVLQGEIDVLGNMQRLGDATAIMMNDSFASALRRLDAQTTYD